MSSWVLRSGRSLLISGSLAVDVEQKRIGWSPERPRKGDVACAHFCPFDLWTEAEAAKWWGLATEKYRIEVLRTFWVAQALDETIMIAIRAENCTTKSGISVGPERNGDERFNQCASRWKTAQRSRIIFYLLDTQEKDKQKRFLLQSFDGEHDVHRDLCQYRLLEGLYDGSFCLQASFRSRNKTSARTLLWTHLRGTPIFDRDKG